MIPSAVFVPAVAIQTTFHSPAKFEKSWEHDKDVFTCFVDLEKVYDRVPCEKLWGGLHEYSVDRRLLLALKSLYSSQTFVSLSGELNHDRSPMVLESDKGVCCHRSFS